MKIYNTLTKKKEVFKPIEDAKVGMYVCGPTVYDEPHLGHARAAYVFEIIRDYFEYKGYKVKFVKNITDVDDKIIARAREELPDMNINEAMKATAAKYTESYFQDMDELGISRANFSPKATKHIKQMIKFITQLIKVRYAYEAEGDVYFDVRKFKHYGRLSRQNLKQMRTSVKVGRNTKKKDALDFALWKKTKEGEPFWDSPWGRGRPGWHIECSVMSSQYLGEEFDIHGGGYDLIFPHHENEIAQSQSYSKSRFAHYWVHNGLLTINQQKMAKSLGNFVSVKDFIHKYKYHPDVLKLFFLQTHYSQPIDFTWKRIEEKREALYKITTFLERVELAEAGKPPLIESADIKRMSPGQLRDRVEGARKDFEKYLDDDFNTPNAIAVLFEMVLVCNKVLYATNFTKAHLLALKFAVKTIQELGSVLGISFKRELFSLSISRKEIEIQLKLRQKLRKKRMFKEADQIRKQLAEKDIILEDAKDGKTLWRRKI